ncbi:MAG TPA: vitamin K epoxide reductase family protein [Streptosporangiaceae bacterium]|nr:vitamin K epoxide reductase family protein [Streptosporangiaceae bacterium]
MAGQKRPRSSSGQGRSGGIATKPSGSGNANGRAAGGQAASGQGQNGRNQNGKPRSGRPDNSRQGQGRPDGSARAATLTADVSAGKAAETSFSAPTWVQWTSLVLSLAGLGMSIYMTIAHYTSTNILVCSNKGYIDCAKVTTSPESMVFNIFPVAVLGLAFYVFMTAINTPWAWRSGIAAIWWARLAGIITGIGFVLYLIYAEVIQIGNLCLDCTTVHIITFLLFVVLIYAATFRPASDSAR